jgi:hypothetical protein
MDLISMLNYYLGKGDKHLKHQLLKTTLAGLLLAISSHSLAAQLTFDDAISGATSYEFDGDGDGTNDVIFSTDDPSGFNTSGPGPDMSYINEPGLEGTTELSTDLRVDFLNGAVNSLGFSFALSTEEGGTYGVTFSIFDEHDNLLNSSFTIADFTLYDGVNPSSFPEAEVSLGFSGIAAYALFDFSTDSNRYIIDNFIGTFGSSEDITPVPIPAAAWLFGSGLLGLMGFTRKKATSV